MALGRIALERVGEAGLGRAEVEPVTVSLLQRNEELPATDIDFLRRPGQRKRNPPFNLPLRVPAGVSYE